MTEPSLSLESIRLATSDITYDPNGSTFRDIMLRHADVNHDGVISLKEDGIHQTEWDHSYSQLRKFDGNGDQTLTLDEAREACLAQASKLNPLMTDAYHSAQARSLLGKEDATIWDEFNRISNQINTLKYLCSSLAAVKN